MKNGCVVFFEPRPAVRKCSLPSPQLFPVAEKKGVGIQIDTTEPEDG
jgi:hypothetical protein